MSNNKQTAKEELLEKIEFNKQPNLLDAMGATKDWEKEWQSMPEFVMGNTEPFQRITISFQSQEDVKQFAELIGQTITSKTASLWYPQQEGYVAPKNFLYVDQKK
jgi:hypothetical protein|tara:strand:+ start:264 stop:578 length:315 start_codon:yes stop_codon:yes gene_type:complete